MIIEIFTKAVPPADALPERKGELQRQRAERHGIEVLEGKGERLTAPADFPQREVDYGDPVNLKYPLEPASRARNARARFKQQADTYEKESSRRVVHNRIVARLLDIGATPSLDIEDPLDKLLSADIRKRMKARAKMSKGIPTNIEKEKHRGAMISIRVPDEVRDDLLQMGVMDPSDSDGLHITLAFLGIASDLNTIKRGEIGEAVDRAAEVVGPIRVKISGFGIFSPGPNGSPVWAAASGPGLSRLQAAIEKELEGVIDLPTEHGFIPHVTIGHVGPGQSLTMPKGPSPSWTAEAVEIIYANEIDERVALQGDPAGRTGVVLKADDDKQLVFVVTMEPDARDTDGGIITVDELEKAAHDSHGKRTVDIDHDRVDDGRAEIVESFIFRPEIFEILMDRGIKPGALIETIRVNDHELWNGGEGFKGASIDGTGEIHPQ